MHLKPVSPRFYVTKIAIKFHLESVFNSEVRQAVKIATRDLCIVGRSLNANLVQEFEFIYE